MAKIAIEAMGISKPGGGRTATITLLESLFELDDRNQYVVFLDEREPTLAKYAPRVEQYIVPIKNRFLARLWVQVVFPFLIRRREIDVVHFVRNLTALGVPAKTVVTIYDMTTLLFPDLYPAIDVFYWRYIQPSMLRHVHRIITISYDTAQNIRKLYHTPDSCLTVIYPGRRTLFRPASDAEIERVWKIYKLPQQVVLHVGSISRKKNLLPLVKGIHLLRARGIQVSLVLVGRLYGKGRDRELEAYLAEHPTDGVLFIGSVPDQDLRALYSGARILAFPSLHEGFGIVPVEAMSCGLPVITSGAGAISEVLGSAAWIVRDKHDAKEWASVIECLLMDDQLWSEMRNRSFEQAGLYDPMVTARQTLLVYKELGGCV